MRILPRLLLTWSMLLVGCGLLQNDSTVTRNPKEEAAVAAIRKLGGAVSFDNEFPISSLTEVEFSSPLATDSWLVHLKGLTKLQKLTLNGTNKVTDAGLVHLKGLTSLESLNLESTQVSGAGLVHLKGMTKLQTHPGSTGSG